MPHRTGRTLTGVPGGRRVFRPGSAYPLLIVSAAIVVYLIGDAVVRSSVGEALLLAPWPLLALWGVYAAAFASSVTIDDDGATVCNLLQVIRVPWAAVSDVQWHWQVEFHLKADGRKIRAVGGPMQGRPGRRPGSADQTPESVQRQFDEIVQRWEAARDAGRVPDAVVRRGWDVRALVALAALVVWAGAAVILTGGPS